MLPLSGELMLLACGHNNRRDLPGLCGVVQSNTAYQLNQTSVRNSCRRRLEKTIPFRQLPARWPWQSLVPGNLKQVSVGISHVDRLHGSPGSVLHHWTLDDLHTAILEVLLPSEQRPGGHKAHVRRTAGRVVCLGFEFAARLVEIDLLRPKFQCRSSSLEADYFHTQDFLIKIAGKRYVGHGQYDMVDGQNL